MLGFLQEPARQIPVALARLDRTTGEQDPPVAFEDALCRRDRVRPVGLGALLAGEVAARPSEAPTAAGTEPPAVEHAHALEMMENRAA